MRMVTLKLRDLVTNLPRLIRKSTSVSVYVEKNIFKSLDHDCEDGLTPCQR